MERFLFYPIAIALFCCISQSTLASGFLPDLQEPVGIHWKHLSSHTGDLPVPGLAKEQTALLVLDIDNDNIKDFVVFARGAAPSVVGYRRQGDGWKRTVIDPDQLPIEAGAAYHDIDGDGDLDIVAGEDYSGNRIYWWENPYPESAAEKRWVRRIIKKTGANKHHDMIFGDFDGDGDDEFVFWNQGNRTLNVASIPAQVKQHGEWSFDSIYKSRRPAEGIAKQDVDGDGKIDIIAGGRWFKHRVWNFYLICGSITAQRITGLVIGNAR